MIILLASAKGGPEKIDDRQSQIERPPLPIKNDTSISLHLRTVINSDHSLIFQEVDYGILVRTPTCQSDSCRNGHLRK